jgi:alkylation response protein AidB-like acyl-CoA dehydrogenase
MDLRYTPEYDAFREEVRTFLKQSWPLSGEQADLPEAERERIFRDLATERGYLYRSVPKKYGGSEQEPDILKSKIILEEFTRAGAPGELTGQGPAMLVPTLLEKGNEAQKEKFIPPTIRGEMVWAQGYSEPGSGSDLASLQCSAVLDGDEWVINGQKIWTSNAVEADYLFGLFRTEPDASKHAGISYLLVDMKAPGVEVRPLKQMTGGLDFNEVFFNDVRTPAENILGQRGEGWAVSRATLIHERNLIANPNMMRDMFNDLLDLARGTTRGGRPATEDPHIRQRLAEIEGFVRTAETSNMMQFSAMVRNEPLKVMRPMMMNKLFTTDTLQMIQKLAYDLLGTDGLLAPSEADVAGWKRNATRTGWVEAYIFSLGPAIAGGASNIQLNIIGERGYGLPRDLRAPAK